MLNKDSILSIQDLSAETVAVPEWGGDVSIRTMTGAERDGWEASLSPVGAGAGPNLANLRARLLVKCIVDEQGKRIFDDGDADALGAKSAAAVERLFSVAQRLNGLSPRAVEDAAKN